MIRPLAHLALAVICLSASTTTTVAAEEKDTAKALETLQELVSFIYEGKTFNHSDIYKMGEELDLKALAEKCDAKYQKIVAAFLKRYESGLAPLDAVFSVFYPAVLAEAELIFRLLYYAPGLWDFIYVTIWASVHVNRYQFRYVLRTTLMHRNDTTCIELPTYYKTLPDIFFNSDFMKQVNNFKIGLINVGKSNETMTLTAQAQYSNWYSIDTTDQEYNLTYFMEDIDSSLWLNQYYQSSPFWLPSNEYPLPDSERRGEIYCYFHKWMSERYNFERLSNNLDEVEDVDWNEPIAIGYSPYMNHVNGMPYPRRKEKSSVAVLKNKYLDQIRDIEARISAAIDSGYIHTADAKIVPILNDTGINILGNIIQGNRDSVDSEFYGGYDPVARNILGFSPEPQTDYQIIPSVLQFPSMSFRDPAFYRLSKKISHFITKFKRRLPAYTKEQLDCDGIKIESAGIAEGNVTTYFEWIETVISEFTYGCDQQSAVIKARQYRLNHDPVTFNLNITSDKNVTAIVRIFFAPKYNVWGKPISNLYKYFYEVDYFLVDLKKGENTCKHKCTSTVVEEAVNSTSDGTLYNYPARLVFPKGSTKGLPAQFFLYVSEFKETQRSHQSDNLLIRDDKPLGFPLDRPIFDFNMRNMALLGTTIYHKE